MHTKSLVIFRNTLRIVMDSGEINQARNYVNHYGGGASLRLTGGGVGELAFTGGSSLRLNGGGGNGEFPITGGGQLKLNGGGGDMPVFRGSGGMPVFRGAGIHTIGAGRYYGQHGAGLGDFFGGLFRRLFPVIIRGATTFVGETLDRHEKGESLGEAAKGALNPTLGSLARGAMQAFAGQRGRGRKRKWKGGSTDELNGGSVDKHSLTGAGKRKRRRGKKSVYKSRRRTRKQRKFVSEGESGNVHYNF